MSTDMPGDAITASPVSGEGAPEEARECSLPPVAATEESRVSGKELP